MKPSKQEFSAACSRERILRKDSHIGSLNRLLSRPSGTLSSTPSEGEGWGEEALRFRGKLREVVSGLLHRTAQALLAVRPADSIGL